MMRDFSPEELIGHEQTRANERNARKALELQDAEEKSRILALQQEAQIQEKLSAVPLMRESARKTAEALIAAGVEPDRSLQIDYYTYPEPELKKRGLLDRLGVISRPEPVSTEPPRLERVYQPVWYVTEGNDLRWWQSTEGPDDAEHTVTVYEMRFVALTEEGLLMDGLYRWSEMGLPAPNGPQYGLPRNVSGDYAGVSSDMILSGYSHKWENELRALISRQFLK